MSNGISLCTGASGFIGSWLCEYLLGRGVDVVGTKRWRSSMENVKHLLPKLKLFDCDLTDYSSVYRLLKTVRPEKIFHLEIGRAHV